MTALEKLALSNAQGLLPPHVVDVVTELQDRVWRLRNLIQCVREVEADQVDDYEAALSGLVEYADSIHRDMDAGLIAERAQQQKAEEAPIECPRRDP